MGIYNGEKKMTVSNESSRQTLWTMKSRKTEKEMDRRRQVQHGGLGLMVEDTGNRAEGRRRTHVADPSPEGFTALRREREEYCSNNHCAAQ